MPKDGLTLGWKLDGAEREALLQRFVPEWPDIMADHITLATDASPDAPFPLETHGDIVGGINDGEGLQAMVVSIAGTTDRPDGGTYHITWSLNEARGRRAVQSNQVIGELGWVPLDNPVPITLIPARLG